MALSFRRFILTETLGTAALNAGINAAYTWWLWRSLGPLTLAGENPVGGDLALTPVFIGLLSTLFGTAAMRKKLCDGRVAVAADIRAHPLFALAPHGIVARSILMAALCAVLFSAPLWIALPLLGDGLLSLADACLTKVVITAFLSIAIVPVMVLLALSDVQRGGARLAAA